MKINHLFLASFVAALAVAGCASPSATSTPGAAADVRAQDGATSLRGSASTGTRMIDRSTDRSVRTIGNQTFKDDHEIKGRGNDLGARSN